MIKTTKGSSLLSGKPLFGLDIGHGSLKVMQLSRQSKPVVTGYGFTRFETKAQDDSGVITKPEIIAKAVFDMFASQLNGNITTKRVAVSVPAYKAFTRTFRIPKTAAKHLEQTVNEELERYVYLPIEELYVDYKVVGGDHNFINVFSVALPRKVVDSYLDLAKIMGLEVVLVEPSLFSSGRLFKTIDSQSDVASVIIDFGSVTSDISVYDGHPLLTSTVKVGGNDFTNLIGNRLAVSPAEASLIKSRYGLGPSRKQAEIKQALKPSLDQVVQAVQTILSDYHKFYGPERPVLQLITVGGGANLPGLSDYLTEALRLAVRHTDPWGYFNYQGLTPPVAAERAMYSTVAGLSLASDQETLNDY